MLRIFYHIVKEKESIPQKKTPEKTGAVLRAAGQAQKRKLLVGAAGLEPARPERTLDFKSKASANSAMPPYPFSIPKGKGNVNRDTLK